MTMEQSQVLFNYENFLKVSTVLQKKGKLKTKGERACKMDLEQNSDWPFPYWNSNMFDCEWQETMFYAQ